MKKSIYYRLLLVSALGLSVLTGCQEEKADSQATYREAGITYMEQGDYANAVVAFEAALQQRIGGVGADELDISYYKAAAQYANGDLEGAMATYNAILDYDDEAANAYYLRGCLYLRQGNAEAGKADFANAVKYNSNEYELYLNIYENLASAGFLDEGETYLNQAFAIKGSDVTDLEYRGRIYYLLGDYNSAITELEAALEAGSTIANLYLAKSYDAMEDSVTAESYYETYLATDATSTEALSALGAIMLEKQQYAQAVSYLEQALNNETKTSNRAAMQDLVIAYEYNGSFDKAWELIQEYVALFPEDEKAQKEYIFLKNRQMKVEVDSPSASNE